MRTLFAIFLSAICFNNSLACECITMPKPYSEIIKGYDFIVHVRIKSAGYFDFFLSKKVGTDYAKVEVIESFKGKINDSIYINGIGQGCDLGIREGDEWLLYGSEKDGRQGVYPCSETKLVKAKEGYDLSSYLLFEKPLYKAQKFFKHPFSKLKNGSQVIKHSDGSVSSFKVAKGMLHGEYSFKNESKIYSAYNLKNGLLHDLNYSLYKESGSMVESKYENGILQVYKSFSFLDSLEISMNDPEFVKKNLERKKYVSVIWQYFPDGSRLSRKFYPNGNLSVISYQDSNYQNNFIEEFDENGKVTLLFTRNESTGDTKRISYHENGKIKTSIEYHNKNGILEEYDQDGKLLKRENLSRQ